MRLLTLVGVTASTVVGLAGAPAQAPAQTPVVEPVATVTEAPADEDVLGDYVDGVVEDSDELGQDMSKTTEDYVNQVLEDAGKLANGEMTGKEFADKIEKDSENFGDVLEDIGSAYGDTQEKNGDAFGNLFDKKTAKTIVNVVSNVFKWGK